MRSNPIRFSGMASGMDTDSIVRDLMRPQQYKIDNQKKQQALLQLKQDAWKDMNKKLFDFHTKMTHEMSQQNTFMKNIVTSSNESAISIAKDAIIPAGTHVFDVTQLAKSATIVKEIADPTVVIGKNMTISFKVSGAGKDEKTIDIAITETQTYEDVAKLVSSELSKNGFSSSYSNGVLFASSKKTGAEERIDIASVDPDAKDLLQKLGLVDVGVTGQDAQYTYNGSAKIFESATNTIEINGVKATLKAANTGLVTISSEPDNDAIYTWVKDFITEYNTLLDDINLKISTKPGKDILPLTAEERETMSDSDIKLWEDKINNSLFYKDAQLESFIRSTRNMVGGIHLGAYNSDPAVKDYDPELLPLKYTNLAALGIVTGKWEERGKLHIDGDEKSENKLREAIASNPEDVMMFFNTLGKKMYDDQRETLKSSDLKSSMNFYNDKVMEKEMKGHAKQISTLEERMYRMESMHYAKFAAMEKMLSSLNNQSSWLAQQFGGY